MTGVSSPATPTSSRRGRRRSQIRSRRVGPSLNEPAALGGASPVSCGSNGACLYPVRGSADRDGRVLQRDVRRQKCSWGLTAGKPPPRHRLPDTRPDQRRRGPEQQRAGRPGLDLHRRASPVVDVVVIPAPLRLTRSRGSGIGPLPSAGTAYRNVIRAIMSVPVSATHTVCPGPAVMPSGALPGVDRAS